jgi:hypothetical protein
MKAINICGFTFCGKTAVHDFFCGLPDVFIWPGHTETQFNRFPGGLSYLWGRFQENGHLSGTDMGRISQLLNGRLPNTPDKLWQYYHPNTREWLNSSVKEVKSFYGDQYEPIVGSFVEDLAEFTEKSNDSSVSSQLLSRIQGFTSSLVEVALQKSGKKWVIWSNVFHPFSYNSRMFFPGIKTIVLERDVRDQFADMSLDKDFRHNSSNRNRFIEEHKRFRKEFSTQGGFSESNMPDLWKNGILQRKNSEGDLYYLTFENFVSSTDTRRDLCNLFDLDASSWSAELPRSRFDASSSIKNVNKYKDYPDLDLKLIQESLSSYVRPD